MPNYGSYYIGTRLLLLKEYLQANAGPKRPIKRRELEAYLTEQGFPVEKKTLYVDFAVLEQVFGLHQAIAVGTILSSFVAEKCAELLCLQFCATV